MRINRLVRVRVVAIAIFALLFAQLSIAAHACQSSVAQGAQAEHATGCADIGQPDPTARNLCAEHCQYGEQSDQPRTPTAPAVSLVILYLIPLAPMSTEPIRSAFASGLLAAPYPPHTILHCCFRI